MFDHMGLEGNAPLERIEALSKKCRRHGGRFTLLWHNSSLVTREQRAAFVSAVRMASSSDSIHSGESGGCGLETVGGAETSGIRP